MAMRTIARCLVHGLVVAGFATRIAQLGPSLLCAADPELQSASQFVMMALEAETEGDFLGRQRLLAEAASMDPGYAPARWQQGKLRDAKGDWIDLQVSMERAATDPTLLLYERRRAGLPNDLASHLSMAVWCGEQGLRDQARAHLNRVLEFDPDHSGARSALGFQFVGTEWIGPEQIAELWVRTQQAQQSIATYRQQLQSISAMLREPRKLAAGKEALMKIQDEDAVPAVEAIFASPHEAMSKLTIDWLATIDSADASQAIARHSLFHPVQEVRHYATGRLKQRPFHDFVPDMLNMLSAPVSAMIVPEFDANGSLTGYRQAFAQEKFDKIDFVVLNRQFERDASLQVERPEGSRFRMPRDERNAIARAENALIDQSVRQAAAIEAANRNAAVVQENRQIALRNARVSEVISGIADREIGTDAKSIWGWWDDYNETKYQAYKPERYRRNALVDRVVSYQEQPACECFVAGTQVTTSRGPRSIEQIVAGDLVLSRSVESGELAWKPVVRSTLRPPEKTLVVSIGDEEFQCTPGHLFWVSGLAWRRASELKAGDILHAAREPVVVAKVRESLVEPTFNLQVADFGSYFVGKNLVMTHDVTPREPTRRVVPGFQP